ncbi:protein rolling stone-like [Toxorhynchites rutilus septentrionalis]|uniref:protein rolling stone-like n=1 Tax=Toxorhynchites rutilus septentrionalis TaxID=329112 RepID=UPI00247AEA55|nr:protein rolling stone-like [Toxorhynchites rutilus septentrionalis]XP_055639297.1 protein rolling stone-like [Toxorhynchites rutilus septentrionalis]
MPSKLLSACKDELGLRNCGMGHMPAEEFVKSQWQSRTKSTVFLLYRLSLAIFFTAVVVNSLVEGVGPDDWGKYFIYLTHWGILMCMATTVMGAALVARWYFHPEYSDKICDCEEMPATFKIYWMMHNITLIVSICITIIYWSILHNEEMPVDANNILIHATNCVFMFIDLIIVAYPVRIWHMVQPICFGLIYCLFSVVYFLFGGTDKKGRPFIYNVLDWQTPGRSMVTVVGTITLAIIVHVLMFFVYKLRNSIYLRFFNLKPILPTNSTINLQQGKACNGISMVYGNENHGFSIGEKY